MNPFKPRPKNDVIFESPPEPPKLDVLVGNKSYIAAIGLIGLAIYQATQKDYISAIQSVMAAIAAFGIRNAIGRQEVQTFQMKQHYAAIQRHLELQMKNNDHK